MSRDKTSTSKIDDQFLQEKQTIVATPKPHSKDDKLEDRKQPSNCVESSKSSLHDKILEQECQPPKDVENEKCPSTFQKSFEGEQKNLIEDIDSKHLMRIMARPLGYLIE